MVRKKSALSKTVHPVPVKIDQQIAREKLAAMGVKIDRLTTEQAAYLASWEMGT
jgi:adenosylhomocysteinase